MNLRRNIEKVYEFRGVPQSQKTSTSTLGIVSKGKKKKRDLTFREDIMNKVPGQKSDTDTLARKSSDLTKSCWII